MIMRLFVVVLLIILALPLQAAAQNRAVPASQEQMQLSFAPVVKQVSPAVVNIYTKRVVSRSVQSPFANDPFFGRFFNDNFFGGRMRPQVEKSLGSGVIVDPEGLVVSNAHVIKGGQEIKIVLDDGREFDAELVLEDDASDLALLRLQEVEEDLPYASLKPSESLAVGDIVLAIGNPFGVGQTVTSGIVSATARSTLNINDFNFFIQTDAAINPGNSGGPLVALDGGVVGINTAIYSRDGGSLGIGFAIPSEMVASVMASAKMGRSGDQGVIRPWLGISAQAVTSDIGESLGLARPWGALVAGLHSLSPLRKAGVKVGDVVQTINDKDIRDPAGMKFRMATVPLGEEARFTIIRNGKNYSYSVKAVAPPDEPPREETLLEGSHPLNGATIANMNPAVGAELGSVFEDEGVVVLKISARSYAARVVQPGDIIVKINESEIKTVKEAERALRRSRANGWSLILRRNGRNRQVFMR